MIRLGRLLSVPALLLVGTASLTAQVLDRPVAIVRLTETVNIGQRELQTQVAELERQLGRNLSAANRREVLDSQINDILLEQAARRANVRVNEDEISQAIALQRQSIGTPVSDSQFRRLVTEQTGLTWPQYVEQITERLLLEKFVLQRAESGFADVPEPTTAEIRRFYDTNAQQFSNPAMVRFDHLFFDLREASAEEEQSARRRARDLAARLERGAAAYDQLIRDSLDDVSYAGGDFGYLIAGDPVATERLGEDFVNAVFDLEEGDISGVLESGLGLHIIRVTDRRSPRIPGLDDPVLPGERVTVRQQIRQYLLSTAQQQVFQETLGEILRELRDEAEITLFEQNLSW